MVRKVALSAHLCWILLILARLAMNGGHVQDPKLTIRGTEGSRLKLSLFVADQTLLLII